MFVLFEFWCDIRLCDFEWIFHPFVSIIFFVLVFFFGRVGKCKSCINFFVGLVWFCKVYRAANSRWPIWKFNNVDHIVQDFVVGVLYLFFLCSFVWQMIVRLLVELLFVIVVYMVVVVVRFFFNFKFIVSCIVLKKILFWCRVAKLIFVFQFDIRCFGVFERVDFLFVWFFEFFGLVFGFVAEGKKLNAKNSIIINKSKNIGVLFDLLYIFFFYIYFVLVFLICYKFACIKSEILTRFCHTMHILCVYWCKFV